MSDEPHIETHERRPLNDHGHMDVVTLLGVAACAKPR